MLYGHEKLVSAFCRLADGGGLSHGYIFFGDPQTGKRLFAQSLASYLETGKFAPPSGMLSEVLYIEKDEKNTIGIDAIREIKHFLSQKPVNSLRRFVIIDDAELMTRQAEHAILKISEEPPEASLMIIIIKNPDVLLQTLQSRFQKIYFPRLKKDEVRKMLIENYGRKEKEADELADISFGRPGMAVDLIEKATAISARRLADDFMRKKIGIKELVDMLVDDAETFRLFFSNLVAELAKTPLKQYDNLRSIISALEDMARYNTNKKLQIRRALWNI